MKKVLYIIFITMLVNVLTIYAIKDKVLMALLEQKKSKIKPQQLITLYQNFLASVKEEMMRDIVKDLETHKAKIIEDRIAIVQKVNPRIAPAQIEKSVQEHWNPQQEAENELASTFGYQQEMESFVMKLKDPNIDMVKLILGYEIQRPGVLVSSPHIRTKKYKKMFKERLQKFLNSL